MRGRARGSTVASANPRTSMADYRVPADTFVFTLAFSAYFGLRPPDAARVVVACLLLLPAITRRIVRRGSPPVSTSTIATVSSRWRWSAGSRSCRSSRSVGRRRRCSSLAASGSPTRWRSIGPFICTCCRSQQRCRGLRLPRPPTCAPLRGRSDVASTPSQRADRRRDRLNFASGVGQMGPVAEGRAEQTPTRGTATRSLVTRTSRGPEPRSCWRWRWRLTSQLRTPRSSWCG